MHWTLWIRLQDYAEECIVIFKMLQNQAIRLRKFRNYWDNYTYAGNYSLGHRMWSHTPDESLV